MKPNAPSASTGPPRGQYRKRGIPLAALVAFALIAVMGFRLLDVARRTSMTMDEPAYTATGLYLWATDDYRPLWGALRFHPPLAYHVASLPLLALDLPEAEPSAARGMELLRGEDPPPQTIRVASRSPFLLVTALGGVISLVWAWQAAGAGAGLLTLFLYSMTPTILGYGSLAHSDMLVSVLGLATLYALWLLLETPSRVRVAATGVCFGLALAAKMTAVLLIPTIAISLIARFGLFAADGDGHEDAGSRLRGLARAVAAGGGIIATAVVIIWANYGGSFVLTDGTAQAGPGYYPAYLVSFLFTTEANTVARNIFYLGELSLNVPRSALFVAYALKTPLPFLVLLVTAVFFGARLPRGLFAPLVLPILVHLGVVGFWLNVPMGVRYLLPIIPLLVLWTGVRLGPQLQSRGLGAAVAVACVWMAVVSARVHPHHLAFFNPLLGGQSEGYQKMVDSNLDWGQSLPALAEYLRSRGNPPIHAVLFGPEDPASFGIRSTRLRDCRRVEGLVAVSATYLQGQYSMTKAFGQNPPGCFDWLLELEPVAQPGYAINVYDVPPKA